MYAKLQQAATPILIGWIALISLSASLVFVIGLLGGTLDVVDGLIGATALGCFIYFCVHHFATLSLFLLFTRDPLPQQDSQVPHLQALQRQAGFFTGWEWWVASRLWTNDGLRVLQHQVLDECLPKVDDPQTRKARL